MFTFLHTDHLPKRIYSRRKEFIPGGSKFFPCTVDPFQKGEGANNVTVLSPHASAFISFKTGRDTLMHQENELLEFLE